MPRKRNEDDDDVDGEKAFAFAGGPRRSIKCLGTAARISKLKGDDADSKGVCAGGSGVDVEALDVFRSAISRLNSRSMSTWALSPLCSAFRCAKCERTRIPLLIASPMARNPWDLTYNRQKQGSVVGGMGG